jgi:hypothetical protein
MAVDPDAGTARHLPPGDATGRRREGRRVLGIDPALEGVAAAGDLRLREPQRLSPGDTDALGHDVDPCRHLGHGMLDLDPRVHLDEEERVVLDQELERADALVADPSTGLGAAGADIGHDIVGEAGRRRLLQDLLVTALERAVAAAEPERVPEPVGDDLDLDVAGARQELFRVDRWDAERVAGLLAGQREGMEEAAFLLDDAHAAPAAPTGRLENDRVADGGGDSLDDVRVVGKRSVRARHAGDARLPHGALGGHLVAHGPDAGGARADEG